MSHLYVMRSDVKLGYSQGQLVIKDGDSSERKIPFNSVDSISVFGNAQLSTQLVRECLSSGATIGYFTDSGHYFGRLSSFEQANPFRQKRQVFLTENHQFCLCWSKIVVRAKILNSITLLETMKELCSFSPEELSGLFHSLEFLDDAASVDEVLGFEGNAAKAYFACYGRLFANSQFDFPGRSSRPPKDPINALLSYGYSFLHRNMIGAVDRHGLHPYFGFLHKPKSGHAALVSDLLEDYRAYMVDRLVVKMVASGDISPSDFTRSPDAGGGVYMSRSLMRMYTDVLTAAMSDRAPFCLAYGDRYRYAFQAALDKKIISVIDALESSDASKYQPFVWGEPHD
ncbi:MAG: CRISPR-associated endonuclease Cas1 [Coriobacteriia bacterium]|nr:CRISPR-associated endonuclease Cas1 [Coriobacteriia bacterium]